jgi:DNA-3-methyladenine glycosylase
MLDPSLPPDEVAPALLGAVLRHGPVAVRLAEVEAYDGVDDPASHAARGRTPRNAVMFGPPGRLYVYFSYGMHWACNLVCRTEGQAAGVLLRAGEVVDGLGLARSRRGRASDRDLARGPGRLTQALAIDAGQLGRDVFDGGDLTLTPRVGPAPRIECGPRVGVSLAADRPWRFWLSGDAYVSDYRRSPRAPR